MLRICRHHVFLNIQTNYYNKQDVYRLIGAYSDKIQNIIVWEKSNPMPACGHNITNSFEYFLVIGNKPLRANHTYTKNHVTTSVNSKTTLKQHRAIMSYDVAKWMFESFIPKGSTVIDPFMGCGTTALASINNECQFIGFEIIKEYCDIANQRLKGQIDNTAKVL